MAVQSAACVWTRASAETHSQGVSAGSMAVQSAACAQSRSLGSSRGAMNIWCGNVAPP